MQPLEQLPLLAKDLPLEVMHAGNELLDHFRLSGWTLAIKPFRLRYQRLSR